MNRELKTVRLGQKECWSEWALLPLRLMIGFGFVAHGYAKLSAGPEKFVDILQAIGVPAPGLAGWVTPFVELVGGLAVIADALLPLVSIPLALILLVAMFTVHLPFGFSQHFRTLSTLSYRSVAGWRRILVERVALKCPLVR